MSRRKINNQLPKDMVVVMDREARVFAGFRNGYFYFSDDWSEFKLVDRENLTMLLSSVKSGYELIPEKEFVCSIEEIEQSRL